MMDGMKTLLNAIVAAMLFSCQPAYAGTANVNICYSQNENCENRIIGFVEKTDKTLLVQAYSFTSPAIAEALIAAHKRGVTVEVILDRSQLGSSRPVADALSLAGIPVYIDHGKGRGIAHNKIMVSDSRRMITGSYNYTVSAKMWNIENAAFISSAESARAAAENFYARKSAAVPYTPSPAAEPK